MGAEPGFSAAAMDLINMAIICFQEEYPWRDLECDLLKGFCLDCPDQNSRCRDGSRDIRPRAFHCERLEDDPCAGCEACEAASYGVYLEKARREVVEVSTKAEADALVREDAETRQGSFRAKAYRTSGGTFLVDYWGFLA